MLAAQFNHRVYAPPPWDVVCAGHREHSRHTPPHVRRHYKATTWKLVPSWAAPAAVKPVRVVL